MSWLRTLASRSAALFRRARLDRELDEELRTHLELLVEENMRRGMSHEEARRWAVETLAGRVTCAVDGSQLLPGREISLPVAAVQVAAFENPHTADGRGYRKEAHFELVTPDELLATQGGKITAADIVGLRRFALELRVLG